MIAFADPAIQAAAWVVLLAVSLAGSFVYSGLETAVYVMNKIRLEIYAEAGSRSARRLRNMLRHPQTFLAVIVIGANAVNYAATFAVSALFVLAGYGESSEWYTVAVVTPVLFIFCESLPKNVAQRVGERMALRLAWPLVLSRLAFTVCGVVPLVKGFSRLLMRLAGARNEHNPLEHESLSAVVAGQASGLLTHFQSIMADRVMHMSRVTLRDVMIPMGKVVAAPRGLGREELLKRMRDHNYSRLPLLDDRGQVFAILDLYGVLTASDDHPPAENMSAPLVLEGSIKVSDGIAALQRARTAMAVVTTHDGRHVGIVTIKDLVEEIVGELDVF